MTTPFIALTLLFAAAPADTPKTRQFLLKYEVTLNDLAPGKSARVWLPIPPTNEDQQAAILTQQLPTDVRIGTEPEFGNQILYTELTPDSEGKAQLSMTYHVQRREVRGDKSAMAEASEDIQRFLKADVKVPVGGKSLRLLTGVELPQDDIKVGRVLYDIVNHHMKYSKEGTGWGQGDSEWACDSRFGNCTDFHSLFISLVRAQKIPAKFEIGLPLPDAHGSGEIAGYHCWAKFKPNGKGWYAVDISEANKNPKMTDYYFGNLTENRVTFSVGRDITLVPNQDGPPLNFFVYPYVELDGKPYPSEKVKRSFRYTDL